MSNKTSTGSAADFMRSILADGSDLMIPVLNGPGSEIGSLVPFTRASLQDKKLIEKLVKWRNQSMSSFLTQFTASFERTRTWLEHTVLGQHDRLLFIIRTPAKAVGHIGFINLTEDSAELDNLVRGEMGGDPKLIYFAERTLLQWMFGTFGIDRIYCNNLSHNEMVLGLHRSLGFKDSKLIPLRRVPKGEEVVLEPAPGVTESPDNLYIQQLQLSRREFKAERDA